MPLLQVGEKINSSAAGTGVAISSLSGAAATNASLAWLGGGTIASGGGGVAVGGAILSGGVFVAAIAVTLAVDKCFEMLDEKKEFNRLTEIAETYSDDKEMDKILTNNAHGRSLGF